MRGHFLVGVCAGVCAYFEHHSSIYQSGVHTFLDHLISHILLLYFLRSIGALHQSNYLAAAKFRHHNQLQQFASRALI
jgi:hypothetical protein